MQMFQSLSKKLAFFQYFFLLPNCLNINMSFDLNGEKSHCYKKKKNFTVASFMHLTAQICKRENENW